MPPKSPVEIRRTSPPEYAAALELVFAHLGEEDRQRRSEEAARGLATRAGDALWGAYRRGELASAVPTSPRAGRTADLWVPRISLLQPTTLVQPLVEFVVKELAPVGIRSVHVLL